MFRINKEKNIVESLEQSTFSELGLILNMDFDQIEDPNEQCRDITGLGKWGNGNVEFRLTTIDDIEYAMYLIRQSYEKHAE